MKKLPLLQAAAVTVIGVGLTGAVASAATGTIDTTGPNSHATVKSTVSNQTHVNNKNHLHASNTNSQSAKSGKADVHNNTTGGGATSGDSSNDNSLNASVTVDNSGAAGALAGAVGGDDNDGSISNTGPNSKATVESKTTNTVKVNNNNNLWVTNVNTQSATTGSAKVSNNTTGGDATSGNASNTNSTDITFDVTN